MTLLFRTFIVSAVLAHAVAEIDALTDAGVVNTDVLPAVDLNPDVLNDADKLGLGSLLPGPGLGRKTLASEFCVNVRKLLLRSAVKETIHGPAQSVA